MNIYIVTSGCYSDYSIVAVFSSREKAQAYIDAASAAAKKSTDDSYVYVRGGNDFNDIEEWILDGGTSAKIHTLYHCSIFLDDGSCIEKEKIETREFGTPKSESYVASQVPIYGGRGVVRAKSHKSAAHALKIAAEARQEWLRTNTNPTIEKSGA